jgi:Ser/Thr protein kinase RdoA (MazF antagonist)
MNTFPAIDSVLDAKAIAGSVLVRYELTAPIMCEYLQRGVNDTYVVHTKPNTYYFRIYRRGWRTRSEIEAEVSMLEHLRKHSQPVSSPVAKSGGGFLNKLDAPEGTRYGVLFTEAAGTRPELTNAWSKDYGVLVAQLHTCLDALPLDRRRFHLDVAHLLVEPVRQIRPFLATRPKDYSYVQGLSDDLAAEITSLPTTPPYYGWCHGDLQGNFHQDADGRTVLYDFDCGGYGWRAYDLAVYQWWWALTGFLQGSSRSGGARRAQRWRSFREGYTQVRELTIEEQEAMPLFVAARHIWLMGLHCRTARTHGRGFPMDLDEAYFDRHIAFIKTWMKSWRRRRQDA